MGTGGFSPIRRLKSSFSLKLAVLFCIVLVVIAAFGFLIYAQTGSALQDSTEENMERSTVLQANTLGEWIDRTKDKTRHLSSDDAVRNGDGPEIESFLRSEQREGDASIAAIHYYDTTNRTIQSSSKGSIPTTAYEDIGARWASEGAPPEDPDRTAITNPYHDPSIDGPAIGFVSAVPGEPGRAIVVVVDLEVQAAQLERPSTANGSFTHVVNDRGTVVLSHKREDINTQNMGSEGSYVVESDGVRNALDGETGYVEMPMGSGRMTMGYAPVPGADWAIMTHVPAEAAYALQDEITKSVLALVAFSLLGLGLVGGVVGRNTTQSIGRLADRAEKMEQGDLDVDLETSRSDEIGQLYTAFDSMRHSLRQQIQEATQAREQAEQARDETARLNDHLERKADEYRTVMRDCAEGDLTRRLNPESESEAMSEIAVEFNQMIAELEANTERLSEFAMEVAAASEEVTGSTEEVHAASEQIATSIQEIADGADRQNENLQTINAEMETLSTTTEQIAASSNQLATLAQQMAETGREGRETAQEAIEGMDEIAAESEQAVAEIEELEAEMDQIDDLVDRISNVAEQTNMLALNANIEASRSTESDEGFSAVAGEVKELAEETKETAVEINERIEAIKSQTERTVEEVQETSEQITHRREAVAETVDALNEIAAYADETNEGVQEISAATEEQAASTQEVVSMVDEAATISEETTAETETVASAGEEQTSALTAVTRSATDLSAQASELSAKLDEFETDADVELERSFAADELAVSEGGSSTDEPSQGRDATGDAGASSIIESDETSFEFDGIDSSTDDSANR